MTVVLAGMAEETPATRCARRWSRLGKISGLKINLARKLSVGGKALRVRQTLGFENPHGQELCKIQERKLRIKDSIGSGRCSRQAGGMVKKALITHVRDRFTVKIKNGLDLEVKGYILDHEYSIGEGWDKIAEVSKKYIMLSLSAGVMGFDRPAGR
ncbi:MAG: hypothetical protein MUO67_03235 [Anaerolineales bacterium]|nr:hypothetical protein [Anaerolineales bacterium]